MSLLQSLDSFVRKECLEMGGELHQLLQRSLLITNLLMLQLLLLNL